MTLIELMITMALIAAMVAGAAAFSVPWIARESARSAAHQLVSALQLTKMEAVKRNVDCRMTVETDLRRLRIWDSVGTSSTVDDILIFTVQLPEGIAFARPDSGDPVTFASIDSTTFALTFASDGSVSAGQGEVVLYGGGAYRRLSVYVAGGMEIQVWDGEAWGA
jgi:Tfp pilus assembly protein FimT